MPLRFILILISAFISVLSFAVDTSMQKAHFLHYTTTDGLASNRIFSLQQDKNGFLWIATEFGLQRFDGRRFKLYNKAGYPNLWRDDVLFVNCDDDNPGVSLGGYKGFAMHYDAEQDKFTDLLPSVLNDNRCHEVKGLYRSKMGEHYMFANCLCYKQNAKNGAYECALDPSAQLKSGMMEDMLQDECGRIWIASVNELAVYDAKGGCLKNYEASREQCGFKSKFIDLGDGKFAVSLLFNELWLFDGKNKNLSAPQKVTS